MAKRRRRKRDEAEPKPAPAKKASQGMAMTVPRALALVGAVFEAKPVIKVLEAHLGRGEVPKPDKFQTNEDRIVLQWEDALGLLAGAIDTLRDDLDGRPIQGELLK